ncbi:type II secretion system F family protein [Novosphingobium sp. fls2-241-R2A-195]|jgi:tight adherence protein B|uniref:type II secretion system F family protein n=1 Tax=Novosphingobium sp. fls2-241-R2A-195 TaxID=3040296 RepID=UPI0025515FDE|nr:type II secretion system F family protein [Novosphingobium sp. fls2-241-R2A-195]
MVKGGAYLLLALLIVGAVAWQWFAQRMRDRVTLDRRLEAIASPGKIIVRPLVAVTVPERIAPLLAQAQVELTVPALQTLIGVMLVLTLIVLLLFGPAAALVLIVGVPMLALSWLKGRARKRVDALTEALPLYLDGVRQLQSVGNSLSQALTRALADAPEAVASYFAPVGRRLAMGAPVAETVQHLADRLRIPEVSMIAAAIRTNLRYGGSIATVFGNLANILRERVRIRRDLQAATSEAKVSARVLIAMPLLAMTLLVAMNRAYIDFFISDPRGRNMSMVAIGLEFIGIMIIRRMMRLSF